MTKKDDDFLTPSTKKIRFRGDLNSYYFDNHVEDIFDDPERRKLKHFGDQNPDENHKKGKTLSNGIAMLVGGVFIFVLFFPMLIFCA